MKRAAFTIDVDPLACYYAIHGLTQQPFTPDPILEHSIPRFLELFSQTGISATFFITGGVLSGEAEQNVLRMIASHGHEIANHSFSHNYRLILQDASHIEQDLADNEYLIKQATGIDVVGFRAPGYNTNGALVETLKQRGYLYDSSFFPSFSYYMAKWILIRLKRLRGKQPASIISDFFDAFGLQEPYFVGNHIRQRTSSGSLLEIPITTLIPGIGVPFIGTSIIAFPEQLFRAILKCALKRDFLNIETHAIDLAAVEDSRFYRPLLQVQPDMRYSLDRKLQRLQKVIVSLKESGFKFFTMRDIALIQKDR